jgi:hypothetical protein
MRLVTTVFVIYVVLDLLGTKSVFVIDSKVGRSGLFLMKQEKQVVENK